MASSQQYVYAVKKKPNAGLIIGAALGIGGIALIALGSKSGSGSPGAGMRPGDMSVDPAVGTFQPPTAVNLGVGQIPLAVPSAADIQQLIPIMSALLPSVVYQGPGTDVYAVAAIMQQQGTQYTTVGSSGVSGIHLPPSPTPTLFYLVPVAVPTSAQPGGNLDIYAWPGNAPAPQPPYQIGGTPVCGAPAWPGTADLWLLLYIAGKGVVPYVPYASPTCTRSQPYKTHNYAGQIKFG